MDGEGKTVLPRLSSTAYSLLGKVFLHNQAMATKMNQRIKHARQERTLTQAAVAKALGLKSREAVSQWEKDGGTKPSRDNLIAFSVLTGAPLDWLTSDKSNLDWDPSQSAGHQREILGAAQALVDHMVEIWPADIPQSVINRAGEMAVPVVKKYGAAGVLSGDKLDEATVELLKQVKKAG